MELEEAIDILENFKSYKVLHGNIFGMMLEQLQQVQKAIQTILEALENSIPKKKIEDKIKELGNITLLTINDRRRIEFAIKILQELLEEE